MYKRNYNGSIITVRRPTNREIGNGWYQGNEWVYTVNNSSKFIEGVAYDKEFAILAAKECTKN